MCKIKAGDAMDVYTLKTPHPRIIYTTLRMSVIAHSLSLNTLRLPNKCLSFVFGHENTIELTILK